MSAEDPTVEVQVSDDGRTCTLTCPFCGRTHTHGLGPDGDRFGHRGAHCADSDVAGGYFLGRPKGMHDLFLFLMQRYATEEGTPLGLFTRRYPLVLPTTGTQDELRVALAAHLDAEGASDAHKSWELGVLEVAWEQWKPPCAWRGCSEAAVDDGTLCAAHELRDLL